MIKSSLSTILGILAVGFYKKSGSSSIPVSYGEVKYVTIYRSGRDIIIPTHYLNYDQIEELFDSEHFGQGAPARMYGGLSKIIDGEDTPFSKEIMQIELQTDNFEELDRRDYQNMELSIDITIDLKANKFLDYRTNLETRKRIENLNKKIKPYIDLQIIKFINEIFDFLNMRHVRYPNGFPNWHEADLINDISHLSDLDIYDTFGAHIETMNVFRDENGNPILPRYISQTELRKR